MHSMKLLAAASLFTVLATPVFAADSMKPDAMAGDKMAGDHMMMKKGETMMVMPDGTMGKMETTDPTMMKTMMTDGKPMEHCTMMMMGDDGKVYMMEDKKMADGTMACDAMMKPMKK